MARVLLLNPLSLLGGEIRDALARRPDLFDQVQLATSDPERVGTLTEVAGAAALVDAFEPAEGAPWDLIVVCDEPLPRAADLARLGDSATVLFAVSPGATEPAVPIVAGVNTERAESGARLESPPAPVVLLAHLLASLRDLGLEQAVASVLLPASDRGQEGLDELLGQTRSLLTFSGDLPKEVWSEQLAFNLLPAQASSGALCSTLAEVLGADMPASVHLLQAGVFHGTTVNLWVQLGEGATAEGVREALLGTPLAVEAEEPDALGPVAAATSDQILVGRVEPDPSRPGAWWIEAVMDNLTRGGALNVVAVAEALLAPRH